MSAGHVEEVSAKLVGLKPSIPSCFPRKLRCLLEIDRWKATEYRQFLLYTGTVVLFGMPRPDLYNHVLCLSVASCILVSPTLARLYSNYGKGLLAHFVRQASILYGNESLVYNVHSLLDLADEVHEYGTLDKYSAFPFENYMQHLK